jgi:hypothetical protein
VKHIRVETAEDFASIPEREWFFVPNGTPVEHVYEGFEMKDGQPVMPVPRRDGRWGRLRRLLHVHPKASDRLSFHK